MGQCIRIKEGSNDLEKKAGGIDSLKSILGLLKRLQIRAQFFWTANMFGSAVCIVKHGRRGK